MSRIEKAKSLTKEARELNLSIGRSSLALGKIYKQVHDEKLFTEVGYETFEAWGQGVGDLGRSQMFSVIQTYTELRDSSIPEEAIAMLPLTNARDLLKIPLRKRTVALVQMATSMSNKEFRAELEKSTPGLTLEARSYRGFQLEESQRLVVNQAINLARQKENLESDSSALELICAQFLASEGDAPQYIAAKMVVDTIESAIDPGNLAKPPDSITWGTILTVVERMEIVFGFKKRAMPRAPAKAAEGARVQ